MLQINHGAHGAHGERLFFSRKASVRSVPSVFALMLLLGFPRPLVPGALGAEGLYAQVMAVHRGPETLSCQAKATIEAPQNSGRWPLHILAKRPGSLRLEGLTPLGDPAAILVADQGRFAFADLRNNVFF